MSLTCLPRRVSQCLRVLGPCFPHWHHLVFSWLLVLHLVYGERANLKALSRQAPSIWPTSTITGCYVWKKDNDLRKRVARARELPLMVSVMVVRIGDW